MKYRSEIDGLRAIAVIPVILFHAGFEIFSGGFAGVDVFFVISGYLITTIILSEKEQGTFSLLNFYERRARRILPALFLVMTVSLPFAWIWLSPEAMKDFSQSLIAVSTFSSNILFWLETGYWGTANELKPLLHTWSLAVEEQYYVLFPLFLMMMWRFRKRWIFGSFILIALISLSISQWGAYNAPTATFFLLPTRGWELAIGASIAFFFLFKKQEMRTTLSHQYIDETLAMLGLLMIAYSVFFFDSNTPFPSLYALIPTLGAGLIIIFASTQTFVARLLSTKPFVGIGLISYSAYLWHQPLLAFVRHSSLTEPTELTLIIVATLSLPLAYLSWRFVEKPFRKSGKFSRKSIFIFTTLGSIFFITIGALGHFTNGWPERFGATFTTNQPIKCEEKNFSSESVCSRTKEQDKLTFLIGDSHSAAIGNELEKSFAEKNLGLMQISNPGCPPIENVYRADLGNRKDMRCFQFNKDLYEFISERDDIKYVIMSARWTLSIEGSRFNNTEGGVESSEKEPHLDLVENAEPMYHSNYKHRSLIADRYASSVQKILDMGKNVILIYPIPEAGWNVPDYLMRYGRSVSPAVGSTSYAVFQHRNLRAYDALDKVGQHPNLYRLYPEYFFCNTEVIGRCIVHKNGTPLYRDDDHLSDAGAKLLAEEVVRYEAK